MTITLDAGSAFQIYANGERIGVGGKERRTQSTGIHRQRYAYYWAIVTVAGNKVELKGATKKALKGRIETALQGI